MEKVALGLLGSFVVLLIAAVIITAVLIADIVFVIVPVILAIICKEKSLKNRYMNGIEVHDQGSDEIVRIYKDN